MAKNDFLDIADHDQNQVLERDTFPEHESPLCRGLEYCGRILADPQYYVWCCSPIYGDDGKVHVFYSRWLKTHSHFAWVGSCEVGHAVADRPEGPYEFRGVALAGRGGRHWDGWSIHNPTVHRVGGKYVIFYMGSNGWQLGCSREELMARFYRAQGPEFINRESFKSFRESTCWRHYFHLLSQKRVGMAWADSLDGPWQRPGEEPLIETGEGPATWDSFLVSNPAFLHHPDGKFWLYYKGISTEEMASVTGNRRYGLAVADELAGPYRKHPDNPIVDLSIFGGNKQCEDAYVFHAQGKFHMVMRDMGFFNHTVGLHFTSDDGWHWERPKVAYYGLHHYAPDEPVSGIAREGRLERPQFLMRDGQPEYLFAAIMDGRVQSSTAAVLKINRARADHDSLRSVKRGRLGVTD